MESEVDEKHIRLLLDEEFSDKCDSDCSEDDVEKFEVVSIDIKHEEFSEEEEFMDIKHEEFSDDYQRFPASVSTNNDNQIAWETHCSTPQPNLVVHIPGAKSYVQESRTPFDCWKLFFDDDIIDIIVKHTNSFIKTKRERYSKCRAANLTDAIEVKAFIGLLYLSGCLKSNRLHTKELWDESGCGVERFRLTMSESRFIFLLRNVRFEDFTTSQGRREFDNLAPIREVFDKFTENCKK